MKKKDETSSNVPGQNYDLPEKNVDAYIAAHPDHVQEILLQVRKKFQETLPEAQERISWGMPTYWKGHNIIHFAGFKNHMGIYPGPQAIEYFAERLQGYKFSKGAIQFPYNEPLPLDLIGDIARWCFETGYHH